MERPTEMIRTIFVPLAAELSSEALLDAALTVAKRVNSHIRALFILPNPDTALAYLPDVILAAGVTREVIEREIKEAGALGEGLLRRLANPQQCSRSCGRAS
jgi:hypothetical protein